MSKNIIMILTAAIFVVNLAACSAADKDEQMISFDGENTKKSEEFVNTNAGEPVTVNKVTEEKKHDEQQQEEKEIIVYVCGAVTMPGVCLLPQNARVNDAVNCAGGFTKGAATEYINLAAQVYDGQKVYVPTYEDIESAIESGIDYRDGIVDITANKSSLNNNQNDKSAANNAVNGSGKININSADSASLQTIPGIGQSKADKIIAYREENGGFSTIEDIMLIQGIKEGMFNKIKDYICVE